MSASARQSSLRPQRSPRGEREDFARLVRQNHRELLVYALALTKDETVARDIVQDAFIVAFEKQETFDITRDFAAWMRGIVRNKWREWARRDKRYQLGDEILAEVDADIAAWQGERATSESTVFDYLDQCLERLPDTLCATIAAFYYEGRSGEEAADHLGIAPAAIRKRLQRARVLLKQCIDNKLSSHP